MKSMQQLVKMPEIQKTMMEMSKEMMKVTYYPEYPFPSEPTERAPLP